MTGNSDDETNFLHKLLVTNKKVANFRKVFKSYYHFILSYQKLNCLRSNYQGDFLVDNLIHY